MVLISDAGNCRSVSHATTNSRLFEHNMLSCISALVGSGNQLCVKPSQHFQRFWMNLTRLTELTATYCIQN